MRCFLFPLLLLSVTGQRLTREENDHLQMICGQTFLVNETETEKSMNTSKSTRNEAPFAIQFRKTSTNGSLEERLENSRAGCSGTIISQRHILTAAHCFDLYIPKCRESIQDSRMVIAAPTNCNPSNTTKCDSHLKPIIINVKRAYIPRAYDCRPIDHHINSTFSGDVAIVELEEDIEFSPTVQPACVHKKTGPRMLLTIYGYGHNGTGYPSASILRRHDSKTMSSKECRKKHGIPFGIKPDEVCSTSNISMACTLDSGSGQTFRAGKRNKAYVSAVTSWGPKCSLETEYPDGYFDVSVKVVNHMDWIWAVTGIHYERRKYSEEDRERFMKKVLTLELDATVDQP